MTNSINQPVLLSEQSCSGTHTTPGPPPVQSVQCQVPVSQNVWQAMQSPGLLAGHAREEELHGQRGLCRFHGQGGPTEEVS